MNSTCRIAISRHGCAVRSRAAFTLIELLIVVGILAILAAIAVPNFLEAQVRAKVSRSQNDLRTLSLGLESYRVDNNAYPRAELFTSIDVRLSRLTTPIVYVTSLPQDPFFRATGVGLGGVHPHYVYCSGNIYFGTASLFDTTQYIGTIYSLAGRGPDANINFGGYCMAHPSAMSTQAAVRGSYDPTNGTTSEGDVLRLSPGSLGMQSPIE